MGGVWVLFWAPVCPLRQDRVGVAPQDDTSTVLDEVAVFWDGWGVGRVLLRAG